MKSEHALLCWFNSLVEIGGAMAEWVQSKYSADGEKWKVHQEMERAYATMMREEDGQPRTYFLPKSEYVPCSPPKRWERVEAMVVPEVERPALAHLYIGGTTIGHVRLSCLRDAYRVVSVVLERKVE